MNWKQENQSQVLDLVTDYRLDWLALNEQDPNAESYWSALVDLRDTSIDRFVQEVQGKFGKTSVLIPNVYEDEEREEKQEEQVVVIFALRSVLSEINSEGNPYNVASVLLGAEVDQEDLNSEVAEFDDGEPVKLPKDGVVMAVIDDGIAIGHNLFRDHLTSTRIHMAYIMRQTPQTGGPHIVGRCIEKPQIDAELVTHTHNGLLDEEAFYDALGIIDHNDTDFYPVALRRSHGTHVMSMAAGFDIDDAPCNRPIICAALPPRVTQDVTGQDLRPSLALSLFLLIRYALRFRLPDGSPAPLVINFSFGNFADAHDGTSPIARLIERAMARYPAQTKRILVPAGNGNLQRIHAKIQFDKANPDTRDLRMLVLPDDRTLSHVQMWMPFSPQNPPPNFVNVRVTPPGMPTSAPVSAVLGSSASFFDGNGIEIARLGYTFTPFPTQRGVITLSIHPTGSLQAGAPLAPAGEWRIDIERDALDAEQAVEVWIRRDDTLPGFAPHGRQAYFTNACYDRFDARGAPLAEDPPGSDCPVRRAGTFNGFADGNSPLVTGAFVNSNGRMSGYSAAGPITPTRGNAVANREGADAAARADDSPVRLGLIGAATNSGSMVRQGGTSTASPLVARYVADGLAAGASADRGWLWVKAQNSDGLFPAPSPIVTRGGGGRLNVPFRFEIEDPTV